MLFIVICIIDMLTGLGIVSPDGTLLHGSVSALSKLFCNPFACNTLPEMRQLKKRHRSTQKLGKRNPLLLEYDHDYVLIIFQSHRLGLFYNAL